MRAPWWLLAAAIASGCEKTPEPLDGRGSSPAPLPVSTHAVTASSSAATASAPTRTPHASPGRIEEHTFRSRALGVDKHYLVYVPSPYTPDGPPFPVVYLLHGLGGNETNWAEHGDLVRAADRIGLRALVVLPDGDAGFYVNTNAKPDIAACLAERPPFSPAEPPASYCVKRARYEDYVVDDLLAEVDARYRTLASRDGRGIGGLSMGGFGALVLAMKHTDRFTAAASTSGLVSLGYAGPHPYTGLGAVELAAPASWGARYPARIRDHVRELLGPDPQAWKAVDPVALAGSLEQGRLAIRLDCGEEDDFLFDDHARHLHDVLAARGIEHELEITRGGHDFGYWKAHLPAMLAFFQRSLAAP